VNSLPLATIYEVKTPLRKWKISLLQRNPAHMTWADVSSYMPQINLLEQDQYNDWRFFYAACFCLSALYCFP
jgi:hypothetical protein